MKQKTINVLIYSSLNPPLEIIKLFFVSLHSWEKNDNFAAPPVAYFHNRSEQLDGPGSIVDIDKSLFA